MQRHNWKKGLGLFLAAVVILAIFISRDNNSNDAEPNPPDNAPNDMIEQSDQLFPPGTPAGNDEVAGIKLQTVIIDIEDAPPVLWEEFFYDLWSAAATIMQFGEPPDWNAPFDFGSLDEPLTYSDLVLQLATEVAISRRAIGILYDEMPDVHWEDNYEEMRAVQLETQNWTEAQFAASLWEQHRITENAFIYVNTGMGRRAALLQAMYGEHGDETPDETVALYVSENNIVRAKHILFSTDTEHGGARDSDTAGVRAAEVYEYLQTFSGDELFARFDELMQEHGEDPGMETNPGGYVFGAGVMMDAFFEGALAINEGTISEPILTDFGYHIILRLPVSPDDELMASPVGPGGPLRQRAALFDFDRYIETIAADLRFTFTAYVNQIDLGIVVTAS